MVLFIAVLLTPVASSAEKDEKSPKQKKEFTKAELLEHIKGTLDYTKEVLNFVPGLKMVTDAASKTGYTYNGMKLEDMDKERLEKLSVRINNEVTRIRTERLNKQLEAIRQAEQASRQARQAVNTNTYQPPRPPTYTQPPPAPPAAAQPPKIPTPPPAPPRR